MPTDTPNPATETVTRDDRDLIDDILSDANADVRMSGRQPGDAGRVLINPQVATALISNQTRREMAKAMNNSLNRNVLMAAFAENSTVASSAIEDRFNLDRDEVDSIIDTHNSRFMTKTARTAYGLIRSGRLCEADNHDLAAIFLHGTPIDDVTQFRAPRLSYLRNLKTMVRTMAICDANGRA